MLGICSLYLCSRTLLVLVLVLVYDGRSWQFALPENQASELWSLLVSFRHGVRHPGVVLVLVLEHVLVRVMRHKGLDAGK